MHETTEIGEEPVFWGDRSDHNWPSKSRLVYDCSSTHVMYGLDNRRGAGWATDDGPRQEKVAGCLALFAQRRRG